MRIMKCYPFSRNAVDIRSLTNLIAISTQRVRCLIICKDEEKVRAISSTNVARGWNSEECYEYETESVHGFYLCYQLGT